MYSAILLSGGKGTRMMKNLPKQYLLIAGKPMIMHSLERLDAIEDIQEIIIVCEKDFVLSLNEMIYEYGIKKNIVYIPAGRTRQESVYNAIQKVKFEDVIIHEAARPFAVIDVFQRLIEAENRNATLGYPIPYTVAQGQACITGVLERNTLVNIQLPQKFRTEDLKQAHQMSIAEKKEFTEDSSMVFSYVNTDVEIIKGSDINIKITEPVDLEFAEIIYKEYIARRK